MCPSDGATDGKDKVEGKRCEAHLAVVHLISLELAMERV